MNVLFVVKDLISSRFGFLRRRLLSKLVCTGILLTCAGEVAGVITGRTGECFEAEEGEGDGESAGEMHGCGIM